jgi:hypothetical protein
MIATPGLEPQPVEYAGVPPRRIGRIAVCIIVFMVICLSVAGGR